MAKKKAAPKKAAKPKPESKVNLKDLITKLKDAVEEHRWSDVARIAGDALKAGADLGEMLFGSGSPKMINAAHGGLTDGDLVELEQVVAAAKDEPVSADGEPAKVGAAAGAIDPNTVLTLVTLVIQLIQQWRKK